MSKIRAAMPQAKTPTSTPKQTPQSMSRAAPIVERAHWHGSSRLPSDAKVPDIPVLHRLADVFGRDAEANEQAQPSLARRPGPTDPSGSRTTNASLPTDIHAHMTKSFGHDFADVAIHRDSPYPRSPVQALTTGRDIHFAPGRYRPDTREGKWLIGHELAHVVQQHTTSDAAARPSVQASRGIGRADTALEREADQAATDAVAGRAASIVQRAPAGVPLAFAGNIPDTLDTQRTVAPDRSVTDTAATSVTAEETQSEADERSVIDSGTPVPIRSLTADDDNLAEPATDGAPQSGLPATAAPSTTPQAEGSEAQAGGAGSTGPNVPLLMPEAPTTLSQAAQTRLAEVSTRAEQAADTVTALPSANHATEQARAAVREPSAEQDAMAQTSAVQQVDDRPAPSATIEAACRRIQALIRSKRPPDKKALENADPAAKANQAGTSVQSDVKSRAAAVEGGYEAIENPPGGQATRPPKPAASVASEVEIPDMQADKATPDPIPDENISLDADAAAQRQAMNQAGMDTEPAKLVQSGPIAEARDASQEFGQLATAGPERVRAEQNTAIETSKRDMQTLQDRAKTSLAQSRTQSAAVINGQRIDTTTSEERQRGQAGRAMQAIFTGAQTRVNELLTPLPDNAQLRWQTGIERLSTRFESDLSSVRKRVEERHQNKVVEWWDRLTGLPEWATNSYDQAEQRFANGCCALARNISRDVNQVITTCEQIVAQARTDLDKYLQHLPATLRKWANGRASTLGQQLDSLQGQVSETRAGLEKDLAERANQAVDEVREHVHALREEAKGLAGRMANAVNQFMDDPARFIIDGLLQFVNIEPPRFWALVDKIGSVVDEIAADPMAFANNLMKGVGQGFQQFFGNFPSHLLQGILDWLFSQLGEAGVRMPADFSLPSIITLFLEILGITWGRIRRLIGKHIGADNVALIEQAVELVSTLMDKGPTGILEFMKEQFNPQMLLDTVIEAVKDYLIEAVITKVTIRIVALFNPAGAIFQAVEAIYRVLKWLFENAAKIFTLVETVVNGVAEVLKGNVSGLANAVEGALAGLIGPVIGFLADYIGLGGIPETIKNAVLGLQERVERILDKTIGVLVDKAKALLARLGLGKNNKQADAGADKQLGEPMSFSAGGEQHRLWIERDGAAVRVKVASVPLEVKDKLADWSLRLSDAVNENEAKKLLQEADQQVNTVENEAKEEAKAEDKARNQPANENVSKAKLEQKQTITAEAKLLDTLDALFEQFGEENILKVLRYVGQRVVERTNQSEAKDTAIATIDNKRVELTGYSLQYSQGNSEDIQRLYMRRLDARVPRVHVDDDGILRKGPRKGHGTTLSHLTRPDIKDALKWVAKQSTSPAFPTLKKVPDNWIAVFATGGHKLRNVNANGTGPGGSVTLKGLYNRKRRRLANQLTRAINTTIEHDTTYKKNYAQNPSQLEKDVRNLVNKVINNVWERTLYFVDSASIPRYVTKGPHVITRPGEATSPSLYTQIAKKSQDNLLSTLKGEIHHFVPIYLGGDHPKDNLVRAEGSAKVSPDATRITAHAELHNIIDQKTVMLWINGRIQQTKLKYEDIANSFAPNDLMILIGTLRKEGSISYQETLLPFIVK